MNFEKYLILEDRKNDIFDKVCKLWDECKCIMKKKPEEKAKIKKLWKIYDSIGKEQEKMEV